MIVGDIVFSPEYKFINCRHFRMKNTIASFRDSTPQSFFFIPWGVGLGPRLELPISVASHFC